MKKFDKIDILVLLVTVSALVYFFTRPPAPPAPVKPAVAEQSATPAATKPDGTPAAPTDKPADGTPAAAVETPAETFELSNPVAKFTFTTKGGGIENATILAAPYAGKTEQLLNGTAQAAIGGLSRVDGELDHEISTKKAQTPQSVVFELTTKDGLLITKTWTMSNNQGPSQEGPGYLWDLSVKIKNTTAEKFAGDNFYLYAGAATQLHGNDGIYVSTGVAGDGKTHEIKAGEFAESKFLWFLWQNRPAREVISEAYGQLTWLGVNNQYYSTLISPQAPGGAKIWTKHFPHSFQDGDRTQKGEGMMAAAGLPIVKLEAGQEASYDYQIFTGPRSGTLLNKIGGERGEAMFYGWTGGLSKLFLWLLNTFNGWMSSFGLAIVLLTIVVRLCIWPLHIKATRSMKRMGLLAPMMNEIKARYKEKPQTPENQRKQQMEMMGLYKDYGVSPVGGCLPLLLQMPIFFGYFGMLNHAVEMRGHSFLWAHDLTLPDTVFHIAGFPINPFPLLMTVTMFIQMKLQPTPPTTDDNQKMQMKIMKFMPVMFLFFCYGYASALALYWTVQNIISIFQTYLVKRIPEPKLVKREIRKLPPVSGAGGGSGRNMFGQPAKEEKPKGPQQPRIGGGGKSAFKDK